MRFSTATVVYTILLPLVSAKCWKDSPPNANKQFGVDNVEGVAKLLQGNFEGGEWRDKCLTDDKLGYKLYFSITNTGTSAQTLDKATVLKYFKMEIDGCGTHGGKSSHNSIEYK
jgi:hypothetical protein